MAEHTNISWANFTASPWFGCTEVSPGCANCYARQLTLQKKWAGWGDKSPRVRSKGFWKDAYRWNRNHNSARRVCVSCGKTFEAAWRRDEPTIGCSCGANAIIPRARMFTSLMDWLDPMVPIEWLADFLKVVHDCQNLDWLLLTKRPELWESRMDEAIAAYGGRFLGDGPYPAGAVDFEEWLVGWTHGVRPTNVWFGVTVENQAMADKRIPILLSIPATVRWLSVEPLLEWTALGLGTYDRMERINWGVVGLESGSKRRDPGVEALINVVEQFKAAGVPCFVKQDCALKPGQQGRIPSHIWQMKEYPKL